MMKSEMEILAIMRERKKYETDLSGNGGDGDEDNQRPTIIWETFNSS